MGLAIDLVPLALVAALIAWCLEQNPAGGEHLRGLQLLTPKEHNRQLHGGALKRLIHGQPAGLLLGKTIIPHSCECEHFLITGNPGFGKSTTIRTILRQIACWFHAAIIIDPEGEYVQEFYCEERGDWILNPHRTIQPLVLADEIKLLRPFTGYLCLAGHHRTTVRIPALRLTRYHPAFIPRAAEPPVPPVAQLSEPAIAAQITARAARSTEL